MAELDELIRVTRSSTQLWKSGETGKALKLLDDSISEAIRMNKGSWVRRLALHAAVLCDSIGDLSSEKKYREQCLTYGSDDPMALYGLAKVLLQQGEIELAKKYAMAAYERCVEGGTELDRALIASIVQRWPELSQGQV